MGRPKTTPREEALLNVGWLSWTTPKPERKWIIVCAVARILTRQPTITADDLHTELALTDYPWDRRTFGAVLRGLHQKGKLEPMGYSASKRAQCHGRPILTYRTPHKDTASNITTTQALKTPAAKPTSQEAKS